MKRKLHQLAEFAKKHKILTGIFVVILFVLFFFLRPKATPPPQTQKVTKGDIVKSLAITGEVSAEKTANLTFPTSGKVIYLSAKEGDEVKEWQVIASLDREKLQANLRQAEQDFTAAKAAVEQVYDQTGRKTNLSFGEKVSQTAVEATQNKAYDAMKKAEKDLQEANIIAPFSGILTHSDIKTAGVNVTQATTFTVTDPTSLEFKMEIDEADISLVKVGQRVKANLNSYPDKTLSLTVDSIDFVTHTTSTGGNAYDVKAKMPENNNLIFRVGMNGNSEIIISEKKNVLSIPLSSITEDGKVFIKTVRGFEKRSIKIGLQSDTSAEVTEGLSEGDEIALETSSIPQVTQSRFRIPFVGGFFRSSRPGR